MAGNRNSGEMATGPLYFCYGSEHEFTLKAEADSPWINQGVSLNRNSAEPALPVTTTPAIADYQTFHEQGATWTVDCPTQPAHVPVKAFQLWAQTEFTSPAYKVDVSLGHHRIDFVEASGHEQFQVIEYGEETTLKAREISYYTKEAMPFAAQWKLGEEDLQSTVPDPSGWVTYNFKTATPGIHPVNVTVPSLYYEQGYFCKELPVHALAVTPWGKDAVLQVNRKDEPDVVDRGVVCPRGSLMMVSLLNENLLLKDSMVSLKSADAKALGIIFTPDLETERPMEGGSHYWNLAITGAKSGLFKLQVHCSKLKRDWDIIGHVLSKELKDEVEKIEVNGAPISDFGAVFFRGESRPLTITFEESMRGLYVFLDETGSPGTTYDPPLKRPLKVPKNLKLEWQVTGGDRSSLFELQVVCADVEMPLTIESRVMSKITSDEVESLKLDGKNIDFNNSCLILFRGKQSKLEIVPKAGGVLVGLAMEMIALGDEGLDVAYIPVLGVSRPLLEAGFAWHINAGFRQSGTFELMINFPEINQSLILDCRKISKNFNDEVDVVYQDHGVGSTDFVFFHNESSSVVAELKPWMKGLTLKLDEGAEGVGDVTFAPGIGMPVVVSENLLATWTGKAGDTSGLFSVLLTCVEASEALDADYVLKMPCRVVPKNIADEIVSATIGGNEIYPYSVELVNPGLVLQRRNFSLDSTITLALREGSALEGLKYKLVWLEGELGVAPDETIPGIGSEYLIGKDQISIRWKSFSGTKEGHFKLGLNFAGRGMIIPGVVVSRDGGQFANGWYFNNDYYPKLTIYDELRILRDGMKNRLRVVLGDSMISQLIKSGVVTKPRLWMNKAGQDNFVCLDPLAGEELRGGASGAELYFDMWANDGVYGGSYEVRLLFPYSMDSFSIRCYVALGPLDH